jgi:hypothetical protein
MIIPLSKIPAEKTGGPSGSRIVKQSLLQNQLIMENRFSKRIDILYHRLAGCQEKIKNFFNIRYAEESQTPVFIRPAKNRSGVIRCATSRPGCFP